MKALLSLLAAIVIPIFLFASVHASDLVISDVNFEDSVSPGTNLPVTVELSNLNSQRDIDNLEIKVWIEDSFGDRISDKATISGLSLQEQGQKELTLKVFIPATTEQGKYYLHVYASGKLEKTTQKVEAESVKELDIEAQDNSIDVSKIELSKESYAPGDSVDLAITVYNNGIEDLEGVTINVYVPELNIQKSLDLLTPLYSGKAEKVYFTFAIPKDAENGIYTVKVTATNGLVKSSESSYFVVKGTQIDTSKYSKIAIEKELKKGKETIIDFKVSNQGSDSKNYTITFESSGLSAKIEPNSFVLLPGQSKVLSAVITANAGGKQSGQISIIENDKLVSVIEISANVTEDLTPIAIAFIILVLIVVAAVLYREYNGEKPKLKTTAYY